MTTLTIKTELLRAALVCAASSEARYYLNGIYVDPAGFLVSIDGHRLFCAKIEVEPNSFEGWIIPRDAAKRALAGYKSPEIEISPERVGDISCRPIDGTFPDWRRVVPQEMCGEVAQFNPAYIADMGKIGEILAGRKSKDQGLTAHIHHNGEGLAGVTFPGHDGVYGVLMPIRTAHTDADWKGAIA